MEPYVAFEQAVMSTAEVVKHVRADERPTPCTEWDVRALLNHMVGTLWLGAALLTDDDPRHPVPPGGIPATDMVGEDPAAAYAEASAAALAASTGDALNGIHTTPLGPMPGWAIVGSLTLDVLVHGWDLAKATGHPTALDDALATHVLAFAQQTITDDFRAPRIGPAIPVPTDASATDRLVAFLGRTP